MTTAQADVAQLQERLIELESEVRDMQSLLRKRGVLANAEPPLGTRDKREHTLAALRAKGMISEPTPEMLALAKEWEEAPMQEKRQLREKLDSLEMDPLLSQRIHDDRR